jgi:orotidine-5'-phosphate decarboxylase
LTPGVRPAFVDVGDQVRVVTPKIAIEAGADYIVVGRPITGTKDPAMAAAAILAQIS